MLPSPAPLPDAALLDLPVFPLPGVVLFPGTALPLHVFEPRYRAMMEACTAEHQVMAVALLKPGYEADYEGRPPLHPVCGAGRIVSSERLPDGRWNLVLQATDRVRIIEELPPAEVFRRIRVERVPDETSDEDLGLAERLQALVARVADAAPRAREALSLLLANTRGPAHLADALASCTVAPAPLRQALLEECCVARRLRRVTDALGSALLHMTETPRDRDSLN
jgi:Lon protease-like protein